MLRICCQRARVWLPTAPTASPALGPVRGRAMVGVAQHRRN